MFEKLKIASLLYISDRRAAPYNLRTHRCAGFFFKIIIDRLL